MHRRNSNSDYGYPDCIYQNEPVCQRWPENAFPPTGTVAANNYDPAKAAGYVLGQLIVDKWTFYVVNKNCPLGTPGSSPDYTAISGGQSIAGSIGPVGATGPTGPTEIAVSTFDFSKSFAYKEGQLVNANGTIYVVAKTNPSGLPGASADYTPIVGPAGRMVSSAFDPNQSSRYVQGQLVVYNDTLYVADKNNPFGIPGTTGSNYTALTSAIRVGRDIAGSFVPTYTPTEAQFLIQGELVTYNGQLYQVGKSAPTGIPGSSDDFILFSGTVGMTGPTGAQGSVGATGPIGPAGVQGPAGAPGPAGPIGPQGLAGAPGSIGPIGPVGPQGPAGAPGIVGPRGPTGVAGKPGIPGPTGPTGANGAPGIPGPTGPAGHMISSGVATGLALGVPLFHAIGPSESGAPVRSEDHLVFRTNTPDGISITVTPGTTGAVVTIDNTLKAAMEQNAQMIQQLQETVNQLLVSVNYDENETATGTLYNGKPVYRRAFNFTITQGANQQNDTPLIPDIGYVDAIVNSGGYWATGHGPEKYAVNGTYVAPNSLYGFAYVSTQNELFFRSNSSLNRENAPAFVWVDYTKV